jgi:hypothetical protein
MIMSSRYYCPPHFHKTGHNSNAIKSIYFIEPFMNVTSWLKVFQWAILKKMKK